MHGHKRSEYKAYQRDPNVAAKLGAKAEQWRTLDKQLIRMRKEPTAFAASAVPATARATATAAISENSKALALTAKLLTVNPDPLTLWNHRRELLVQTQPTNKQQSLPVAAGNGNDDEDSTHSMFELTPELDITQTALENNPKAYGAWFHRKWCLQQWLCCMASTLRTPANTDAPTTPSSTTPSSTTTTTQVLLQQELELTVSFLQRDERNFHCWNYRRFIVSCLLQLCHYHRQQQQQQQQHQQLPPAFDGSWEFDSAACALMGAQVATSKSNSSNKMSHSTNEHREAGTDTATITVTTTAAMLQHEWDFCRRKIRDNFSNFSAFHYRSKLLPWMLQLTQTQTQMEADNNDNNEEDGVVALWTTEFQLVENAIFTEPDDQTAWWYHRFLLDAAGQAAAAADVAADVDVTKAMAKMTGDTDWYTALLQQQHGQLQELVTEVADSKWAWLGYLLVLERMHEHKLDHNNNNNNNTDSTLQEQADILQKLMTLDPDRQERYRHLLKKTQRK